MDQLDGATLPRGVHRLPCRMRGGGWVLFTVTGRGECLDVHIVLPGEDERAVAGVLAQMLDREDPPS